MSSATKKNKSKKAKAAARQTHAANRAFRLKHGKRRKKPIGDSAQEVQR